MMTPKDQKQQRLDDNEGLLFRPDNEGQQTTNIILSVNSLAGRTNRATLAVALSGGEGAFNHREHQVFTTFATGQGW